MNAEHIESKFTAMGARFRTRIVPRSRRTSASYAMDIRSDRRGEFFELRVLQNLSDKLDVNVLQARANGSSCRPRDCGLTQNSFCGMNPFVAAGANRTA